MAIDLHIHSKCSDGKLGVKELFTEAKARHVSFMAITDHDNINAQEEAIIEAKRLGIGYVTGVELNVTFSDPKYYGGKPFSLDFLGYQFNHTDKALTEKLAFIAKYREERGAKILDNLNAEFRKEGITELTKMIYAKFRRTLKAASADPTSPTTSSKKASSPTG
jgi:predicted metal-dependent phosphoesterase TrpH